MRILFTFIGGNGHFVPLIPVARAAEAAGHTIAFGSGPSMAATVEAAGFTLLPLGTGAAGPPERIPLRPLDAAREDQEFRDRFARRGAGDRAPQTIALCTEWRPDVLVCDETDFGGMMLASGLFEQERAYTGRDKWSARESRLQRGRLSCVTEAGQNACQVGAETLSSPSWCWGQVCHRQ